MLFSHLFLEENSFELSFLSPQDALEVLNQLGAKWAKYWGEIRKSQASISLGGCRIKWEGEQLPKALPAPFFPSGGA